MLGQRRRRWANIKAALVQRIVCSLPRDQHVNHIDTLSWLELRNSYTYVPSKHHNLFFAMKA